MKFNPGSANADRRQAERDPETQRRILAVAERLFLAKGFKGVSMKDIAEEVQVTAAALYYYFPQGKQELFMSMVKNAVDTWTYQTYEAVNQVDGIRAKLTKLSDLYFSHHVSDFFALIRDVEEFCLDKPSKQELFQRSHQNHQHLVKIFQQSIDEGELGSETPASMYAVMYQGMIMGIQMGRRVHFEKDQQLDLTTMSKLAVSSLLDGIAKKP